MGPLFAIALAGTQRYLYQILTMVKKFLFGLIAIPFLAAGDCNTKNIPTCVKRIIADAKQTGSKDAPVQIDEYTYMGERVFLFTAPCCDQYNTLYDMNCNPICAPSGGIKGDGDGKCKDFSTTATFVRNLWKKE